MASVSLNPAVSSLSGRIGGVVFYSYNGNQYLRRYVVPRDPGTGTQRVRRGLFSGAVKSWQELPQYKKIQWKRKALILRTSGYSLFISSQLRCGIDEDIPSVSHPYPVISPASLFVPRVKMPVYSIVTRLLCPFGPAKMRKPLAEQAIELHLLTLVFVWMIQFVPPS